MLSDLERQQLGQAQLKRIRRKYFSAKSEAADWWDKLTPEWRGVVLHAAAIASGNGEFKAHLAKCCWRELCERLDYRELIQLRQGISRARLTFGGFGSLRDGDFSKRTAQRPVKQSHPINSYSGVEMIIAPEIVSTFKNQENH
ncbi:hypothetical protein AWI07_03820 [Enterobacter roggenkampii]|uniref:hypothetical protein n=1 Tax=Enterobacter roggenkampii TaxID=1812935 RepID=UPI0007506FEE|nr:hypothetical protein [Enterobacter roggenkampii]KUQ05658.1 hypothetical protein AWI07_03820 [Enterobacter roggenkampii]